MSDDFGFDFDFGFGFDWNGNGKHDIFDSYMDMKASGSDNYSSRNNHKIKDNYTKGSNHNVKSQSSSYTKEKYKNTNVSKGKKQPYNANKDSDGVIVFKSILSILLCLGGIALPTYYEMNDLGMLLCIIGGIISSIAVLNNIK